MSAPKQNVTPLTAAIDKGVLIVQTSLALEPLTTLVMLDQIAGAHSDLGVQMPNVTKVKVLCGGSRVARSRFQQVAESSVGSAQVLDFVDLNEGVGDQPIALELLTSWLPSPDDAKTAQWWVVRHTLNAAPTPNFSKTLERAAAAMRKAGTRMLILLATDDPAHCKDLENMVDDYLVVRGCEDDMKSTRCLSIECLNEAAYAPFTSSKVMCSVRQTADGVRFRFKPFVSSELDVRVMARLRGDGRTYDDIGKIVHMDKSTVLRRLRGITITFDPIDPKWLDAVKDHYGADARTRQPPD